MEAPTIHSLAKFGICLVAVEQMAAPIKLDIFSMNSNSINSPFLIILPRSNVFFRLCPYSLQQNQFNPHIFDTSQRVVFPNNHLLQFLLFHCVYFIVDKHIQIFLKTSIYYIQSFCILIYKFNIGCFGCRLSQNVGACNKIQQVPKMQANVKIIKKRRSNT